MSLGANEFLVHIEITPSRKRKDTLSEGKVIANSKEQAIDISQHLNCVKFQQLEGQTVKADQSILQRLIIAYEAGRNVNLEDILKQLLPIPISIAEIDSSLGSGQKSILLYELTKGMIFPQAIDTPDGLALVIDGQALV